jgi:hypothetical protein
LRTKDILPLQFYVGSKARPSEFGQSLDQRELGIFLSDIRTAPPQRDLTIAPITLSGASADTEVLWHGFSSPKHQETWAVGPRAEIQWKQANPLPKGSMISIEILKMPRGIFGPTSVRVFLNGMLLGAISANDVKSLPKSVFFPIPDALTSATHFELTLKFRNFLFGAAKPSMMIGEIRHSARR